MQQAFEYVVANSGLDTEADYPYAGESDTPCWTAAEKSVAASVVLVVNDDNTGLSLRHA